jgi:hypothetical protein
VPLRLDAISDSDGFPPERKDTELNNEIAYLSWRPYEYIPIDPLPIVRHTGMQETVAMQ